VISGRQAATAKRPADMAEGELIQNCNWTETSAQGNRVWDLT